MPSKPLLAGTFSALTFASAAALAGPRLDDTGATQCLTDSGTFTPNCAGSGQDGEFGRDATHGKDFDGRAGFRFKKLDAAGAPLAGSAASWRCVRDEVTGLTWEVKSDNGSPRDMDKIYTAYGDGRPGDTSTLVAEVNADGLCGANDWRLPTLLELQSLVDYGVTNGGPAIDGDWFPNTATWWYWTSTPYATDPQASWAVFFSSTAGGDGAGNHMFKLAARLVRGPIADDSASRFVPSGDEVTDTLTQLVWRRCTEGQQWNGSTCTGVPSGFAWVDGIAHAKAEAARTGLGWRVPNAKELASVADRTRIDPAIDPVAFPATPRGQWYWSGTPVVVDATLAWANEFSGGYTGTAAARAASVGIRLVRDAN